MPKPRPAKTFQDRANNFQDDELESLSRLLRILGDRTRVKILMLLGTGPRNVNTLCDDLKLPQPTVSHHLGLLRMSNLVCPRRNGKQVFYSLDTNVVSPSDGCLQIDAEHFQLSIAK